MARIFRLLLNLLTALSLLLLLTTAGLWLRSYSTEDWLHSGETRSVDSQQARVSFTWHIMAPPVAPANPWVWESAPWGTRLIRYLPLRADSENDHQRTRQWSLLGLGASSVSHTDLVTAGGSRILTEYYLRIPYWLLCLPFLPLPALYFLRRVRSPRHPPGTCQHCGYDLRASKLRCPECGTPIPPRPPTP